MTDQEIIKQVKQGDIEQFAFIVERYHHPLLGFTNTITRNPPLTEDIGQMVFLAFFKTLESFDENLETLVLATWSILLKPDKSGDNTLKTGLS